MRELASVEAPYRGSRAFPRRKAAKNDSAAELRSPDLPANIFGEMLRDVLASAPVPKKEIPALKETGFFIGRFLYLCDAWDDRESDKKHSLFNPFNICGCTRDDAEFIINISINSAISAYNLLSTGRDRAILDNILFQGLFAEGLERAAQQIFRRIFAADGGSEQRKEGAVKAQQRTGCRSVPRSETAA